MLCISLVACIISLVLFVVELITRTDSIIVRFLPDVLTVIAGMCIFACGVIRQTMGEFGIVSIVIGAIAVMVTVICLISYSIRIRYIIEIKS